jgi:hypothetical protein
MSMFCSVEDVAALLQMELDEYNPSVRRAILEASAAIQNYCHQTLELVEDDVASYMFAQGPRLFLPEVPVNEVSEVIEDGEELTETEDYLLADHGVLHRVGQNWAGNTALIQVTYSHGYATLPDDLVAVATRAAARSYQAGLRAANANGVPGISSTTLGDYSVSFTGEGGGQTDGVMGVSAAAMLLRSEKEILDRYRVRQ